MYKKAKFKKKKSSDVGPTKQSPCAQLIWDFKKIKVNNVL